MTPPSAANYVIILKHETLSGKRKSGKRKPGEEHSRNRLLRHSLIAALALATIRLRGSQATRHLRTSTAIRTAARSCTTSTPTGAAPYYQGLYHAPGCLPAYALAAPITALPGAAVYLAFSLIGAC